MEVDAEPRSRLDDELLRFFTGTLRDAGNVLAAQHQRVIDGDTEVRQCLHEIKELAAMVRLALAAGDSAMLGAALGRHGEPKRGLSAGVSRRSIILATTALLGVAAAVTVAAPAQAAPTSINFNNVTGTTHLAKPNVDVAVPSPCRPSWIWAPARSPAASPWPTSPRSSSWPT